MSKVDLHDSWWNGVTNRLTNGLTDNAISRVAFATENYKIRLKLEMLTFLKFDTFL